MIVRVADVTRNPFTLTTSSGPSTFVVCTTPSTDQALPPARHRELRPALDGPVEAMQPRGGLMTDARVRTQREQAGQQRLLPRRRCPGGGVDARTDPHEDAAPNELVELRACDVMLSELSDGDETML